MALLDFIKPKTDVAKIEGKIAALDAKIVATGEKRRQRAFEASLADDDGPINVLAAEIAALRDQRSVLVDALAEAMRLAAIAADAEKAEQDRLDAEQRVADARAQHRASVQHVAQILKSAKQFEADAAALVATYQTLWRGKDAFYKLAPSNWPPANWPGELAELLKLDQHVTAELGRAGGKHGPALPGTEFKADTPPLATLLKRILEPAGPWLRSAIVDGALPPEPPPPEPLVMWPGAGEMRRSAIITFRDKTYTHAEWCAMYSDWSIRTHGITTWAPDANGQWHRVSATEPTTWDEGARHLLMGGGGVRRDAPASMREANNLPAPAPPADDTQDAARMALERGEVPQPHIAADIEQAAVALAHPDPWAGFRAYTGDSTYTSEDARREMAAKSRKLIPEPPPGFVAALEQQHIEQHRERTRAALLVAHPELVPADATTPAFTPVAGSEGSGSPTAPAGNPDENTEGLI